MARAYQEAHILDSLRDSVKSLQAATTELSAKSNRQEEKIKNLNNAKEALEKKNRELELRMKANEHNATARVSNSHIAQSPDPNHAVLTPLHDLSTNRPIRQFPKHERDVKTMGQSQVVQILQALDLKTLGMGAAQKKAELRAQVGLVREGDVTGG